jgi:hypothetical protein
VIDDIQYLSSPKHMPTPTITQLQQAIAIAEKIEKLQAELAGLFGGSSSAAPSTSPVVKSTGKRGGKRTAQQARWAKIKGPSATPAAAAAPVATARKKKRKLSPEGRARIIAALKARHAAKRNAQK